VNVWTTVSVRLSLIDKNIDTFARFHAYISEKSHTKNVMYFLTKDAYALAYTTCMATPLFCDRFSDSCSVDRQQICESVERGKELVPLWIDGSGSGKRCVLSLECACKGEGVLGSDSVRVSKLAGLSVK